MLGLELKVVLEFGRIARLLTSHVPPPMPPKNGACRFRSIEKGCARRLGLDREARYADGRDISRTVKSVDGA